MGNKTILLVEDESVTSILTSMTLQKFGYDVVTADSGINAVDIAASNKNIDLILMDIDLGEGIDGTEAAVVILKDRDIPVVFLSSHIEPEIVEKTEKITSYGYVVKNSGPTVLDASIKMAFKLFDANQKIKNELAERKLAEEKLSHAKTTWDKTFNSMSDIVCMISLDHTFLAINEAGIKTLGLPKENIIGKKCYELIHGTSCPIDSCPCSIALQTGKEEFSEYEQDGKNYILQASPMHDNSGKISSFVHNIKEITDRRKSDKTIERQNIILNTLLNNLHVGVMMIEAPSGRPLVVNEEAVRLLGRGILPDASRDNFATVYKAYKPESNELYPEMEMPLVRGLLGESAHVDDMVIVRPDGTRTLLEVFGSPLFDKQGNVWASLVSFMDITEQKRTEAEIIRKNEELESANEELNAAMEEMEATNEELLAASEDLQAQQKALRESEERHALILFAVNDGFWDWNVPTGNAYFSSIYYAILGYENNEFPADYASWRVLVHPDDINRVEEDLKSSIETGIGFAIDLRMKTKSGKWLWVSTRGKAVELDADGKAIRMVGTLSNITERKESEYENKLNEARLRKLVDILQHPADTIQEFLDYALEQSLQLTGSKIGYIYHYKEKSRQLVLNSWSRDVMPNCAVVNPQKSYELDKTGIWGEAVRQRKPIFVNDYQADHPLKKGYPEGHVKLLKFITIPIFRGDSIVSVVGLANKETDYLETDVLQVSLLMDSVWKVIDRKMIEEELIESEQRLQYVLQGSQLGYWDWNLQTNEVKRNERWAEMLGYTLDEIEFSVKQWIDFIHPDDQAAAWQSIQDNIDGKSSLHRLEYRMLAKDGQYKWILDQAQIVEWDLNKHPVRMSGTHTDITNRKLAEEKIKSLLSEKEIILREVNHRIKNNMNVIYGLLMLQSYEMKDPRAISALKDSAMRVQSMMILYDKLYRSSDVQNFSVMDYISTLADEIVSNFPNSNTVKIRKKIENFILDAKRLQTIGIIINELLTNIMKYAFIGGKKGNINLSISLKEKTVSIAVEDNGIGMPASINFEKSTGFGLKLVGMLTKELKGEIHIEREKGTRILLEFEL